MNQEMQEIVSKINDEIEVLLASQEDWVEDTLNEAKDDAFFDESIEAFVEENNIKDVPEFLSSGFDEEIKQEVLQRWINSLEELADIKI